MVRRSIDIRDRELDVSGRGLEHGGEGMLPGDIGLKRKIIFIPSREDAAAGAGSTNELEIVCKGVGQKTTCFERSNVWELSFL